MKRFKELLFKFLEGELNLSEEKDFQTILSEDKTAFLEKQHAEQIGDLFSKQEMGFKPFFVGRLMNKIEAMKERTVFFWLQKYSPKIALASFSLLLLLLITTYFQTGSMSLDTLIGVDQLALEDTNAFLETDK